MKKILLLAIAVSVILGIFYFLNGKEAVAPATVPAVVPPKTVSPMAKDIKPKELCFAKFGQPNKDEYYDQYTLRLILNGEKITGELNLLPADKDAKTGEIKGVAGAINKATMARTANLWWFNFAEGKSNKEEVKIIFSESAASVGFGETVDRGDGVYVYKNPKNISYALELSNVSCGDLIERVNVENYLQDNISKLSPVKAVLGGSWYIISATISTKKNSGAVIYEDGHIQEKRNFSYTVNEKGEIASLVID